MPTITLRPANGPLSVTAINCGGPPAAVPGQPAPAKLGGSINISPFSNLTSFRCNNNDIVSITGYEDKSSITLFECFSNKITGSIPNLNGMSALKEFRMYTNLLSGPIPTENISGLSAIEIFNYGGNSITGNIPTINNLTTLKRYICDTNLHTGGIPNLTGLTNLTHFYAFRNNLNGNISSLSGLTALQEFRCYENLYVSNQYSSPGRGLGGGIPSLAGLSQLKVFQCYRNALTGEIPSLAGLTQLQEFTCYDNLLSDQIPPFSGVSGQINVSLTNYQCHDNNLTGPIPATITNLPAIQIFNCGGNDLTGAIPSTLPNSLTLFACDKNKLSSTIPSSLPSNIVLFACDNNRAIPAESITGVNGPIPNLTGLTKLETFRCNDTEVNDYSGTTAMPGTLGKFHAFNTNLTEAAIDKILKAFVDGGRVSGDRFINLGGRRTNGTLLTPSFSGGTKKNTAGSNFNRPAGSKTVTVTNFDSHGYVTNQLVTITSAVYTVSGVKFTRVGNTVTVDFPAHGFSNGQSIIVGDVSETSFQSEFKGTFTIIVGSNPNTFQYTTSTSGALAGTGMATISDNTFNNAFKGTFKVTRLSTSSFSYVTSSTSAVTGSGTATLRSTTTSTDGYAYYQKLTEYKDTTPATTPWNVVINQPLP